MRDQAKEFKITTDIYAQAKYIQELLVRLEELNPEKAAEVVEKLKEDYIILY